MTAVAIVREKEEADSDGEARYRAITPDGGAQAVGRTAGQALDALTAQLAAAESGTLIIVQHMRPDHFFTQQQIDRLGDLTRRAQNGALTAEEEHERHALIEAELLASAQRSAALADSLGR